MSAVLAEPIHRGMLRWAMFYCGLFVLALALSALDDRQLIGVSVWLKPAKFALSTAAYLATLAWCLQFTDEGCARTAQGRAILLLATLPAALENGYIFAMAARGEPSHFNTSSPATALAYSLMAFGAVLMVVACAWLALVIAEQRRAVLSDPLILSVVLGLLLTFFLGGGFGVYLGSQTSHWVGAASSDAGGLPLVSWSRTAGDLRVAHFFGMHAMQALPLVGFVVRGWRYGLPIVVMSSVAWSVISFATFLQALSGMPLFAQRGAPDAGAIPMLDISAVFSATLT